MSNQMWELGGRLLGNAIAQRQAQAQAERERIEVRPHRSLFQPVAPPLSVETWHNAGNLRVGCPWGWLEVAPVAGYGEEDSPLLLLQAERYDEALASLQILRAGSIATEDFLDAAAIVEAERAKFHRLEPHAPISYVLVDGELGVVIQLQGKVPAQPVGPSVVTEILTVHHSQLYQALLLAPERDHLAYLQILWTVVGTWQWVR